MTPRIAPLPAAGNEPFTQQVIDDTGEGAKLHLFRTIVAPPGAAAQVPTFRRQAPPRRPLNPATREIAILRIAHRVRCRYEASKHHDIALAAGLSKVEVDAIEERAVVQWSLREQADSYRGRRARNLLLAHRREPGNAER